MDRPFAAILGSAMIAGVLVGWLCNAYLPADQAADARQAFDSDGHVPAPDPPRFEVGKLLALASSRFDFEPPNATMHKRDEALAIEDLKALVRISRRIALASFSGDQP